MSVAAAAVVGGALISSYSSGQAADAAADASSDAAASSAQATIRSTQLQIDEISRQFDYQQSVLQPQVQQQFNAQRAYSDLLGFNSPGLGDAGTPGPTAREVRDFEELRASDILKAERAIEAAQTARRVKVSGGGHKSGTDEVYENRPDRQALARAQAQLKQAQERTLDGTSGSEAQFGAPGSSGLGGNVFQDPNLDPRRLAETETLSGQVRDTLLAGTGPDDDPYRNYINDNRLAADTLGEDVVRSDIEGRLLIDGAAGTGVYGDVFNESPGYAFQVEEQNRALERVGSRGGPNIGGRAIMEAQRRAQGLAAGEYYNWAAGRERDLVRAGQAESADAGRLDSAALRYGNLMVQDQQRGDAAYQDYNRRLEGDAARLDSAAARRDALEASDLQRADQSYYNYLDAIARQAGFGGGSAAQAVNASGAAGQSVANAYAQQGGQLAGIYQNEGTSQANIAISQGVAQNNAIQGGIQNWFAYQNSRPATQPTTTTTGYTPPPGPHS
ncbi:MAG: hypothetical protein ACR2PR_07530 [Pseudohongiellaceae bacterium]